MSLRRQLLDARLCLREVGGVSFFPPLTAARRIVRHVIATDIFVFDLSCFCLGTRSLYGVLCLALEDCLVVVLDRYIDSCIKGIEEKSLAHQKCLRDG